MAVELKPTHSSDTCPHTPATALSSGHPPVGDNGASDTAVPARLYIDHDRLMDCIHCGLCLSQCPTYAEEGLEPDSPRGRIYIMRSLTEGRAEPTPALVEHLDLCLGCRACETACPSGVQYGHLIEQAREYLHDNYERPWKQRVIGKAVEALFPHPNRMEAALLPVRVLRRTGVLPLLRRLGVMDALGPLGDMERMLPTLPPMQRRLNFPQVWRARGQRQAQVGMITGCVMQVMQTPVNEATARVLAKAGCDVAAPKTQGCCGALHAHTGDMHQAKEFAKNNIEAFEQWQAEHGELEAIIINAAGCGSSLKEYTAWFKNDPAWAARAKAFSDSVKDVNEFLALPQYKERLTALMTQSGEQGRAAPEPLNDVAREAISNTGGASTLNAVNGTANGGRENELQAQDDESSLHPAEAVNGKRPHDPYQPPPNSIGPGKAATQPCRVTYHDACHLCHGQGIRIEPRELLETVPGIEIVPLAESEMCCGSAGSYNITQPAMAMQLLERKMEHIMTTGAGVVVTSNPGCMLQIIAGAKKYEIPIEVKHPVEVLDRATDGRSISTNTGKRTAR